MAKHRQTKKQFSLKDELFNKTKVRKLASEIKAAYPEFNQVGFEQAVLKDFPKQELMERVRGIRDQLRNFLPRDFEKAVTIMLKALPPELDPKQTDNDFGDFIHAPYTYYVATYGSTNKNVSLSLNALREITKRFSAEGALRDFLNSFPKETLAAVEEWSKDKNYHVRRLASEGTRPFLPWASKVTIDPKRMLPILDRLHSDPTRYVVRSVSNHMNDLAKIEPKSTIALLKKWQKAKQLTEKDLQFLINHSLRTLIKEGNQEALKLIGYDASDIRVSGFKLAKSKVAIGTAVDFYFTLTSTSTKEQSVLIDYIVHFKKANGTLAPKTFKIAKKTIAPKDKLKIQKSHPMRLMSTRTLYSGEHVVELQINGRSLGKKKFNLI